MGSRLLYHKHLFSNHKALFKQQAGKYMVANFILSFSPLTEVCAFWEIEAVVNEFSSYLIRSRFNLLMKISFKGINQSINILQETHTF